MNKKCPFCHKKIQKKAVKCNHCKEWLNKKKSKKKSFFKKEISFKSLYWLWLASMVIFLITHWVTDAVVLLSGIGLIFLAFDVLVGGIAFFGLLISLPIKIFSKNKDIRFEALTYLLGSIGVFVLFFLLFTQINNSFTEASNPNNIQESNKKEFERCYLNEDNDVWVMVESNESCEQKIEEYQSLEKEPKNLGSNKQLTPTPKIEENYINSELNDVEWGKAEKIGDQRYTMKVGFDPVMGTPQEIFQALNVYRNTKGVGGLSWDEKLASLARERVLEVPNESSPHEGFNNRMNQDGFWDEYGIVGAGENSSKGYRLSGTHLIEWMYASDEGHNTNQLNQRWSHAGIATSGSDSVLIFGSK